MNILCVNHTGIVSGAERSLLDLLSGLREHVNVRLACPSSGPLAHAARALGVEVDEIPGTDGSLKLRARETTVALGRLGAAAAITTRHARHMGADVIHANSIRAGLLTIPAARVASVPAVVHLRDRLPRSAVADASLRLIALGAKVMVANSFYTADGLRLITKRGRLKVVYNPVDLKRFDRSQVNRLQSRARFGVAQDTFLMAVIGQLTPWKGQLEAIQTLARLRKMGRDVRLLVVGEPKFVSAATRYDNRAYYAELKRTILTEGIGDCVTLLGERQDIPEIMAALDALLVPSWDEPFGRVVVEAMALAIPVLATSVGGPAEIIDSGANGILLRPSNPDRWAGVVAELMDSGYLRERLGQAATRRAADFALPSHVSAMTEIYADAAR